MKVCNKDMSDSISSCQGGDRSKQVIGSLFGVSRFGGGFEEVFGRFLGHCLDMFGIFQRLSGTLLDILKTIFQSTRCFYNFVLFLNALPVPVASWALKP